MALPILDGNQSATTLSTILSSGQHITAHTVVSLGTQAITDIVNATSAGLTNTQLRASAVTIGGTVTANVNTFPDATTIGEQIAQGFTNYGSFEVAIGGTANVSGTVTIGSALPAGTNRIGVVTIGGGTVTIGAGTAQIGTVTASNTNLNRLVQDGEFTDTFGVPIIYARVAGGALDYWQEVSQISGLPVKNQLTTGGDIVPFSVSGAVTIGSALPAGTNRIGVVTIGGGTVTIGAGTAQIGSVTAGIGLNSVGPSVLADSGFSLTTRGMMVVGGISTSDVGTDNEYRELKITSTGEALVRGSVTASISGTVPISISSVTVGNSVTIGSFATSVTARLINPAGTAVTYAEVGTAGSPSIDVLSVQGVSGGTSLLIGGTTGSFTTRFGSVTTANTAQISTAVTNLSRKYLFVQNVTTSSNVITVGIGFTPTTTQGIQLAAGALIDFESSFIPTGAVYILSSVTGSPFTILEA
jgi:hypothetical protein